MNDIEFSGPQIVRKTKGHSRLAGAIQNIDLNPLAFPNEHVRPIDLAADGMRKNGPGKELSAKQTDQENDECDKCPGYKLESKALPASALPLATPDYFIDEPACGQGMELVSRKSCWRWGAR